jgi:hypothetical protein
VPCNALKCKSCYHLWSKGNGSESTVSKSQSQGIEGVDTLVWNNTLLSCSFQPDQKSLRKETTTYLCRNADSRINPSFTKLRQSFEFEKGHKDFLPTSSLPRWVTGAGTPVVTGQSRYSFQCRLDDCVSSLTIRKRPARQSYHVHARPMRALQTS